MKFRLFRFSKCVPVGPDRSVLKGLISRLYSKIGQTEVLKFDLTTRKCYVELRILNSSILCMGSKKSFMSFGKIDNCFMNGTGGHKKKR